MLRGGKGVLDSKTVRTHPDPKAKILFTESVGNSIHEPCMPRFGTHELMKSGACPRLPLPVNPAPLFQL